MSMKEIADSIGAAFGKNTLEFLNQLSKEKGEWWTLLVYVAGTGKAMAGELEQAGLSKELNLKFVSYMFNIANGGLQALGDFERARFEELLKDADTMINKALEDVFVEHPELKEEGNGNETTH